jgi:hypothetical protein
LYVHAIVCSDPTTSPIVGDRLQLNNPVFTPVTPGGGGGTGACALTAPVRVHATNATAAGNARLKNIVSTP